MHDEDPIDVPNEFSAEKVEIEIVAKENQSPSP